MEEYLKKKFGADFHFHNGLMMNMNRDGLSRMDTSMMMGGRHLTSIDLTNKTLLTQEDSVNNRNDQTIIRRENGSASKDEPQLQSKWKKGVSKENFSPNR